MRNKFDTLTISSQIGKINTYQSALAQQINNQRNDLTIRVLFLVKWFQGI